MAHGDNSGQMTARVDALLRAAFDSGAEADLVSALRADGYLATEITYADQGALLGYAALSRMIAPAGWLCLAPVAVAPAAQGRGIGSQVVRLALKWATERDRVVVVLGDPEFYGALGFSTARAANLRSPYPVSHMLLAGPGKNAPDQTLTYPAAFDGA